MFPYLLSLMLGITAHSAPGSNSVSIVITFSGTVVPVGSGSADIQALDPSLPGVYKIVAEYVSSGSEDHGTYKSSFLVVDRLGILESKPVMLSFSTHTTITPPNILVIAMEWPNLTDRQVIAAFKRSYRKGIKLAMRAQ